jgi:hypothetical protein
MAAGVPERNEIEVQALDVPKWAMRLIYRLGMLRKGEGYLLTVLMTSDEPVWSIQPLGKLENDR